MTDIATDRPAVETSAGHSGSDQHGGAPQAGAHHGPSDATFVKIAVGLGVVTAFEVWLSYADIGVLFMPLLMISMLIKFFVVVLYFMHLKFDHPLFRRMFWLGLFLAPVVYGGTLATFHFFQR